VCEFVERQKGIIFGGWCVNGGFFVDDSTRRAVGELFAGFKDEVGEVRFEAVEKSASGIGYGGVRGDWGARRFWQVYP
jgi:hypothetical protein